MVGTLAEVMKVVDKFLFVAVKWVAIAAAVQRPPGQYVQVG